VQEVVARSRSCRGIVHLWGLDAPVAGENVPEWAQVLGCLSVLHLVQACAAAAWAAPPRLYLVTRGVQAVRCGEVPRVGSAPLWGLGRVVRSEHAELRCTLIDLGPEPADDEPYWLIEELRGDDVEGEIALRGPDRFVRRLLPVSPAETGTSDADARS